MKKDIDARFAEEALLSSLLYKPDKLINVIDEINPNIFSVREFGEIYKCIIELYKDDIIPDEVTVISKSQSLGFDIVPELIKKLCNGRALVTKKQLKQYCNIIKTSAFKRKTIDLCSDFLEKAKDISSPEQIVSDFSDLVVDLSDKLQQQSNLDRINIDTNSMVENILHKIQNPDEMNGLPFGFPTIDKATDGACPGEIITLAGMNGGCKTYYALSIMKNMAKYLLKK